MRGEEQLNNLLTEIRRIARIDYYPECTCVEPCILQVIESFDTVIMRLNAEWYEYVYKHSGVCDPECAFS